MPDEVQITNVAPGIHIPVVVENKPNEPVPVTAPDSLPVEVRNNPEIRGTVDLAPNAAVQLRPPAFLMAGKQYKFLHTNVGLVNPVTLLSVDGYPWVRIQSNGPNERPFYINLELLGSIEEV